MDTTETGRTPSLTGASYAVSRYAVSIAAFPGSGRTAPLKPPRQAPRGAAGVGADARRAGWEGKARRSDLAEDALKLGGRDPFLIATLIDGVDDVPTALAAMKQSHPYMFGAPIPAASHDMNGGEPQGGTSAGPQTELGKFIADRFG